MTREVSIPSEITGSQEKSNVTVKILTPLKSNPKPCIQEEEEKNRETAILLQNGIQTNLIGRITISIYEWHIELLRIGKLICFFGYQIPLWTCFVYQQNILQVQFFTITEMKEVSTIVYLLYELLYPIATLLTTTFIMISLRYSIKESLRLTLYGIKVFL